MMKKILKISFHSFLVLLINPMNCFCQLRVDGKVNFDLWQEGDTVNVEKLKTSISPKKCIFSHKVKLT